MACSFSVTQCSTALENKASNGSLKSKSVTEASLKGRCGYSFLALAIMSIELSIPVTIAPEAAIKLVRETLDKFLKGGVTEAELKAAKDNIIGGFPMRIDSNGKILDYLAMIGFYKLPLNYLDEYNKNVAKVTTAQIKEVFNRRLKPENFVTVIVGDPSPPK